MALISQTQPAAGQPMQFTMNKNDLLAVPKVMADPFFSLEANWFRVSFVFKHTTSGRRFVPSFRTFTSTKYLRIRQGMNGGDGFELKKIIISKSDRTFLVINTNEIPSVGDYVFSLMSSGNGGGSGSGNSVVWTPSPSFQLLSNGGIVASATGSTLGTVEYSGDFVATFVPDPELPTSSYSFFGMSNSSGLMGFQKRPTSWATVVNGSVYPIFGDSNGSNDSLVISKSGSTISFIVNGTTIHTEIVSSAPFKPQVTFNGIGDKLLSVSVTVPGNAGGGSGGGNSVPALFTADFSIEADASKVPWMVFGASITGGKLKYVDGGQADINSNLTAKGSSPIKVRVYVSSVSIQSVNSESMTMYFQHWDAGNVGSISRSELESAVSGSGYIEKTITQGSHFAGSLCFNLGTTMTSGTIEISKIEIFDV